MSRKQPTPPPDMALRPAPPEGPPNIRFGTLPHGAEDVRDVTANGLPVTHAVWHPTAVDLPEDHKPVLIVDAEGEVWLGFNKGAKWFDIDFTPLAAAPKFWAYFPEAPK